MARDFVCLYHSYLDAIQALGDAERGRLMTAMLEYSLTGAAGELGGNEKFIWPLIKAQIDRDTAKYETQCKRNSENGKTGGRPKKRKNPVGFSESEKSQGKGEGEGKGKGEGKGEGESPSGSVSRFAPPTVAQVAAYCAERQNGIDPQRFVDFYASKGWKVGREPMEDWKAAVRTWEHRRDQPAPSAPAPSGRRSSFAEIAAKLAEEGRS